jgi:hypothetical protein
VSEETSIVSVARDGRLFRNLSTPQVRDMIAGRTPRPSPEHPIIEMRV